MNQPPKHEDWRIIAAEASTEMDPAKLMRLVAQLCESLDEGHKIRHEQPAKYAA